jgi:hypothetical protein
MLKKISHLIFGRIPSSAFVSLVYRETFKFPALKPSCTNSKSIAVEVINDQLYFGLTTALLEDIQRGGAQNIFTSALVVRSVNASFGFSIISELKRSFLFNWLVMRQWLAAYGTLINKVGFRSSSLQTPIASIKDLYAAYKYWKCFRNYDSSKMYDEFEIEGILCGDLIIDSYLRYKPSPSFNLNDIFIYRLIWQAIRDIRRVRQYFKVSNPAIYFTTYSTYIEHGISVRVAIEQKIPVFSFGNFFQFGLQLSSEHFRHTPDARYYKKIINQLPEDKLSECIKEAESILEFRMSGGIDKATGYMRQSAYQERNDLSLNADYLRSLNGSVVIFLHDFYDSPHVWDDFIFTDFWEWVVKTIEVLRKEKINFFIKPHPNQFDLKDNALKVLRDKYPDLKWLNSAYNNRILVEAGIVCGVTVYGTVAHELAYLGVPSVGAALHVHQAFSFCRQAKTIIEYESLIINCRSSHLSKEVLKREALEFFVAHNLLYDKESRELSEAYLNYWVLAASAHSDSESNKAMNALMVLRATSGYLKFITKIKRLIGEN